ncbi:MAG: dihydroorotase [Acidobacteria bacterium]|nr:dihydroorotase [Acidobacteriota bacterium]
MARGCLLAGARLVDPAAGRDGAFDVRIAGDRVAEVAPSLDPAGAGVVDCRGLVLAPGFVDLHTHLREPGREDEETVESGSRAAALGGYTAVCAMANSEPVADSGAVVEQVWTLGRAAGLVDVFPVGAITVGLAGRALAELGEMAGSAARVGFFSDDGRCLQDSGLMRRALEYARVFDAIVANHAEDSALAEGWQMNEGEVSSVLGLAGLPAEAEEVIVARDLALARLTGARLHVPHVSTAGTVELIRVAKRRGVRVTAEATPHHLTLTEEAARGYDPVFKVAPPLRAREDVEALRAGLADGTIDCVATDHAPHAPEEKDREWDAAPCGMLGLETALAVLLTELVPGHLALARLVEAMSAAPARARALADHGGPVAAGRPANLVVFDPEALWTVDAAGLASRSRNTPFGGRELRGKVVHTIHDGRFTVRDGRVADGKG